MREQETQFASMLDGLNARIAKLEKLTRSGPSVQPPDGKGPRCADCGEFLYPGLPLKHKPDCFYHPDNKATAGSFKHLFELDEAVLQTSVELTGPSAPATEPKPATPVDPPVVDPPQNG
jgi:hypothetical protein